MPAVWAEVLATHRRQLDRLIDARTVAPLRRLYDQAAAEMVTTLHTTMRRLGGNAYSSHAHRVVLAQLRQGQAALIHRMAGEVDTAAEEAARESLHNLVAHVHKLDAEYGAGAPLPIEQAARFQGLLGGTTTSLLHERRASLQRYGAAAITDMERQLSLSLVEGEGTGEAIGRIEDVIHGEWWRAERIARTEISWTYNATHAAGIRALVPVMPDLRQRWTEHVSDGGMPLDQRVGVDSLALHGQVAAVGQGFYLPDATPDGELVPESLERGPFFHPPNRPNDRAVLSAWRPGWGIPGWRYDGGRRVPLNR